MCKRHILVFCKKEGLALRIFLRLKNNFVVDENLKRLKDFLVVLENSGIDARLPLFKVELYQKTTEEYLKFLKALKNLDAKKISFNALFFCDSKQNFCLLKEALESLTLNFINAKLYDCSVVDYRLLCAINTFNINTRLQPQRQISKAKNPIFIVSKNQVFDFEFSNFKNFSNVFLIDNQTFFSLLFQTYDFVTDQTVLKVCFQNRTSKNLILKMSLGKVFGDFDTKNRAYYYYAKGGETKVFELFSNQFFKINKTFKTRTLTKEGLFLQENICLKPFEKAAKFLSFSHSPSAQSFDAGFENERDFYNSSKNFLSLKLPKVLTSNKVLNYLLNDFLPNKIFEKTIASQDRNFEDFKNLTQFCFDPKKIKREILHNNLNKFFLIQKDFFICYFNLFYAFLGVWFDGRGLKINPDKSSVFNEALVCFDIGKKIFVKLKKNNSEKEIKLNNITFTNLTYVSFDNKKNKELLDLQL